MNSFTSARAAGRFSAATESSRSRISASAGDDLALASFFSLSAGTKRRERRSWKLAKKITMAALEAATQPARVGAPE